jgi:hypothetical protein
MRVPQQAGQPANIINHIIFEVDESSSMGHLAETVVKVFDSNVSYLAAQSRANGQETRVTVYLFNSRGTARCVIYDMDVLRVPSIAGMYRPRGMTSLRDTQMLATGDARLIPQKYGDHSFLFIGVTDGGDNDSPGSTSAQLTQTIESAPENETYLLFVPGQREVHEAKRHGFPSANIALWDASSPKGMEEAGQYIRDVSDRFMQGRAEGIRGYNTKSGRSGSSLLQVREFSASEVTSSLPSLTQGSYYFLDVPADEPINGFMVRNTDSYSIGSVYYEHTKAETIQPQKEIAVEVVERAGGEEVRRVYTGRAARSILGLPDAHVRVKPNAKNGCTVFVQSTSPNRKLIGGTRVLVMR